MLYLSVKYYRLINQENQLIRKSSSTSRDTNLSRRSMLGTKSVNNCLTYFVLWVIFSLSLFRIVVRDIIIPISEWPLLYK